MHPSGTSLARHAQVTPTDATIRSLRRPGGCGSVFGPRNWISPAAIVWAVRSPTLASPGECEREPCLTGDLPGTPLGATSASSGDKPAASLAGACVAGRRARGVWWCRCTGRSVVWDWGANGAAGRCARGAWDGSVRTSIQRVRSWPGQAVGCAGRSGCAPVLWPGTELGRRARRGHPRRRLP